jgi:hypothetical protein|tara:strand:+ start:280 stop:498 length:219 start_codon:yes stop_codon:yes gene_type:complete
MYTTKEEIQNEIKISRTKLMHLIIERCRETEKNIDDNYNMGLITFEERLCQFEYVCKAYKKELKPFNDLYFS